MFKKLELCRSELMTVYGMVYQTYLALRTMIFAVVALIIESFSPGTNAYLIDGCHFKSISLSNMTTERCMLRCLG